MQSWNFSYCLAYYIYFFATLIFFRFQLFNVIKTIIYIIKERHTVRVVVLLRSLRNQVKFWGKSVFIYFFNFFYVMML